MNVVNINTRVRTLKLDTEVMDVLRYKMHGYNAKDLAEEIGCSVGTIYGIRNGRTKWPRGKTLFALLKALDIELRLYDTKTQRYL